MKLTPIDLSDIPESRNGNLTKHRIRQIEAFLESGEAAAEVTDYGAGSPENVAAALASAARRHKYRARAITRGGRVFLLRMDAADE